MDKYIRIPVTNEGSQLVQANDIKLIEQASTTTLTVNYGSGRKNTITFTPAAGSNLTGVRDTFQSAVGAALSTDWTSVSYDWSPGMINTNTVGSPTMRLASVTGIENASI